MNKNEKVKKLKEQANMKGNERTTVKQLSEELMALDGRRNLFVVEYEGTIGLFAGNKDPELVAVFN